MSIKDLVPKFGKKGERMPIRKKDEDSLLSFQREMNRLFDDFFNGFGMERAFDWDEPSALGRTETLSTHQQKVESYAFAERRSRQEFSNVADQNEDR